MTYFNTTTAGGTGAAQTLSIVPPINMLRGMLVVMFAASDSTGAQARSINNTGGQQWNQIYNINQNSAGQTIWWCIFNGTWSTNPVIDFTAATPSVTSQEIELQVFSPTSNRYRFGFESLATSSTTGSTTCTVTGVTTVNQRTVALASWATSGTNTWNSLTAGWSYAGLNSYGASGSQLSASYALQIFTSPQATGNVSNVQATGGPSNCLQHMIIFYEYYKSQILD